jgi:hypothetical protein
MEIEGKKLPLGIPTSITTLISKRLTIV